VTLIDPWVIQAVIWFPLGVAMLSLLLVAMVGTQAWRRVPVEVTVAAVVLAIVALPHLLW
jgi:hypothetical protein